MNIKDDELLEAVNENIKLIRKKNGLTFGTDAYLLAAYMPKRTRARAVELGGGTGIMSLLLLAADKCAHATAIEIQSEFCDLMERNAALNDLSKRFTAVKADVRDIPMDAECADIVFSNPPYMKADSGKRNVFDEKFIARHEVHGDIADFCAAAARLLKYGGNFYCVYRPDRLMDLLAALRQNRLEPKKITFVHADMVSEPSIVLVEAKKGAASTLRVTKPLFLHDVESRTSRTRPLTPDAAGIYEAFSFDSFLGE